MEGQRQIPQDPAADLNPKQILALAALLGGKTQAEAAEAAGVAERTVALWLRDVRFAGHLREGRARLWTECTTELHSMTRLARRTLYAVLEDPNARAWEKVNAARAILELSRRAADVDDLNQRIRQLEAQLEEALSG